MLNKKMPSKKMSISNFKKDAIYHSRKFSSGYKSELYKLQVDKLNVSDGFYKKYYFKGELIAIKLRKINHDLKKLIIGCGNQPTSKIYHNTIETHQLIDEMNFNPIQEKNIKFRLQEEDHCHNDAITIDIDITMNPTIVADFGKHKLLFLRDHNYDEIIFEGISKEYLSRNNINFNSEIERLLSTDGKIIEI
jgi:hypothetical protein